VDGVADCIDNCPNAYNPGQQDCDNDQIGDACAIQSGAPDCNMNSVPDSCDLTLGSSLDQDGSGVPDECEQGGVSFCFGDGTTSPCPCGNFGLGGRGCANSTPGSPGAQLAASGSTFPTDTIVLTASGERPTAFTIFLQGDALLAPAVPFGDGLRCAGGALKRIAGVSAVGGIVSYPGMGNPSISARSAALGDPIPSGASRVYNTYYRDPNPSFCPAPIGSTFNSTQALLLVW
jgi:hypothetical protein